MSNKSNIMNHREPYRLKKGGGGPQQIQNKFLKCLNLHQTFWLNNHFQLTKTSTDLSMTLSSDKNQFWKFLVQYKEKIPGNPRVNKGGWSWAKVNFWKIKKLPQSL